MITIDVTGLNISRFTVIRRLKIHGVKARVAAKKEFLTDAQKRQQYNFVIQYGDRDDEWWKSVIFSDEKTFG